MEKTFTIPHFPHDINASNDPKLISLRIAFGWAGLGIFWAVIEALHREPEGKLPQAHFDAIVADAWSREGGDFTQRANDYKIFLYANALLVQCGDCVSSTRAQKNLDLIRQKSEKARASAQERWGLSKPSNANAKRRQSERYAIREEKRIEKKNEKESVKKKDASGEKGLEVKTWEQPKTLTPKEQATEFFAKAQALDFEPFLSGLLAKGIPDQVARAELSKFCRYWTEPNGTGQKQRWQLMDTFEVPRRLITWLERAQKDYKPEGGGEAWRVPLKLREDSPP